MRTNLEKFLITPDINTPQLNRAAEAWDNFDLLWSTSRTDVLRIVSDNYNAALMKALGGDRRDLARQTPDHIESVLSEAVPDFIVAANGLRRALDGLSGMHLAWNTVNSDSARRGKLDEDEGWVRGNLVGSHPAIGGSYVVQLEVADSEETPKGAYVPFTEMYAIRECDADFFAGYTA